MRLEAQHIQEHASKPRGQKPCRSKILHICIPPRWLMDDDNAMKFKADAWQHILSFSAIKQLRYNHSMRWQNVSYWHSTIKLTAQIVRWAHQTILEGQTLKRSDNCKSSSTMAVHVHQEHSARHLPQQSQSFFPFNALLACADHSTARDHICLACPLHACFT